MNFTQPEQTLVVVPDEDEVEGLWKNELWRVRKYCLHLQIYPIDPQQVELIL